MVPNQFFNVIGKQVTLNGNGVKKVEGYYRTANALSPAAWLQYFDTRVTPVLGTVPIKSDAVYAQAGFFKEFERGELTFTQGIYIALSTTEATFTATTDTMDLYVELIDADIPFGTTVTSGSGTNFNPWLEAAGGTKKLHVVAVANLDAAVRYLQLFATDGPNTGDKPLMQWPLNATGVQGLVSLPNNNPVTPDQVYLKDTLTIAFANSKGYTPVQQIAGVNHVGCFFGLSRASGTWLASITSGMNWTVQYK